ncbi:BF3164 family lipoprotein [Roseivirga pacifica]|uniref:BF3164 family lipoprotein n=1 Tax=Roseivirga pacifica TaxID=1267423 RepID=UPI003BAFE7C5
MQKKSLYQSLLILIFIGYSCSKEPVSDFNISEQSTFALTGNKIYLPELIMPYKIERKDSFLIVIESSRLPENNPLIHIINKKDLSYHSGKGVMGIGPNEITDAHLFDPGFSDSTFWVNSTISKRMAEFSLYDSSKLSISEFKQPQNMYSAINMQLITDSSYLCVMAADPNKLVAFNRNGERLGGYGKWETLESRSIESDGSQINNYIISEVNSGWFKRSSFGNLYVKAGIHRDRLEIFDFETKRFITLDGPRMQLPDFDIVGSGVNTAVIIADNHAYGHRDIAFSEDFIYDLYGGYSEQDYLSEGTLAKTIYVIEKRGSVRYKLDLDISIRCLTVDQALGKIYGITTDEDPGIAVFDMPQELLDLLAE